MTAPSDLVLVVGAAGSAAGEVVPVLAGRGVAVRAMVRHEEQRAGVLQAGRDRDGGR